MTEATSPVIDFTLELELPAADWPRFRRRVFRAPQAVPAGRSHALHVSWYDGATAHLAQAGLSLSREHAVGAQWQLEQTRPDGAFWPPGAPAPVLGVAGDPVELGIPVGEKLAELARFEGRVAAYAVRHEDMSGMVSVRAVHGTITSAGRSAAVCRIAFAGPEADVAALALGWAVEFPLRVPRAGMAEAAAALAGGRDVFARRLGAPSLQPGQSTGAGFAQVVAHLTDVMLHWAEAIGTGGGDPEPVHQTRVALRRLRSAFAVFRPAVAGPATEELSAALRDLARALGPARDWDVFLAGAGRRVGVAFPDDDGLARILAAGTRRRDAAYEALGALRASAGFRVLGIRLALLAGGSAWRDGLKPDQKDRLEGRLEDFAALVLARRYRRMRRAGRKFGALDAPALHALRLLGKRMRYAAEFFAALFDTQEARRFIARLSRLQEGLGLMNDRAVAADLMRELERDGHGTDAFATGLVLGFVAGESASARAELRHCWKRFRRLGVFWE